MNISLKNPFAKLTSATSPASGVLDREDSLKGKRLLRGRTKARVESITAENEADRIAAEQVKHTLSEQLGNEQDTTETMSELAKIEGRIRAREAVLAIAVEKDIEAQRALANAARQASIAAEAAARARLAALGPRGEEILAAVTQFSADMEDAADALRLAGGNERYAYSMGEARAQWELFLGIAKRPPSTKGADSGAFRKYKTFTACVEAVCGKAQP